MKKRCKLVSKFAVSFISVLLISSLFCFSASAEELQSNGYNLHPLSGTMTLSFFQNGSLSQWVALTPAEGNVYSFANTSSSTADQITFSAVESGFDIVFNQVLYDYYFVVTVFADSTTSDFTFFPDYMSCQTYPCDDPNKWYAFQELSSKHFDTQSSRGYTIIGRLNRSLTSSRIQQISMSSRLFPDDVFTIPANLKLSCSVIEVPKNSVTASDITSIINAITNQTSSIINNANSNTEDITNNLTQNFTELFDITINGTDETDSTVSDFNEVFDDFNDRISEWEEFDDSIISDWNDANSDYQTQLSDFQLSTSLLKAGNWLSTSMQHIYDDSSDYKMLWLVPLLFGIPILLFVIKRGSDDE